MAPLIVELEAAMQAEIMPKVLDILVEIAKEALYHDDREFAVEVIVLALQYPMREETLEEAENMFTSLESQLCPRVIHDAWEQAQRMTLEDMVAHVQEHATE